MLLDPYDPGHGGSGDAHGDQSRVRGAMCASGQVGNAVGERSGTGLLVIL